MSDANRDSATSTGPEMSTTWPELVTTALLGVSRRPLSGGLLSDGSDSTAPPWAPPARSNDGAQRLLDLAAAHRTLVAVGTEPPLADPPAPAPTQRAPSAPAAAGRVLEALMERPDQHLITCWLESCVATGHSVEPLHWCWLARAAQRSTAYDRALVGRALGEAGRWFVRQNPEWRRLSADLMAAALTPPPPPPTASPVLTGADLAADPERLFAVPDPWPAELVAAAWGLLGSGVLGVRGHNYAVAVGLRLPPSLYPRLGEAATYYLQAPEASPALRRDIRHNFVQLERAAFVRAEIAAAFATAPGAPAATTIIERVEIPRV